MSEMGAAALFPLFPVYADIRVQVLRTGSHYLHSHPFPQEDPQLPIVPIKTESSSVP